MSAKIFARDHLLFTKALLLGSEICSGTKRKVQGRAGRDADKVQRSKEADADLFEADAGEAADSESESIHGVGNAEFEADACQAGVNVADEGDDGQGDDSDACDSKVAQHGVDEEC